MTNDLVKPEPLTELLVKAPSLRFVTFDDLFHR
jgi:hypothetical protein